MYKKHLKLDKPRFVPVYKELFHGCLGPGTRQNRLHCGKKKDKCMTKIMPSFVVRELRKLSLP